MQYHFTYSFPEKIIYNCIEKVVWNYQLGTPEQLYDIFVRKYKGSEIATVFQIPVKLSLKGKFPLQIEI